MKTRKIPTKPDYIGALRQITPGETQVFKMIGTAYSSMRMACLRLNKGGEGVWNIEIDSSANEMKVTRFS